MLGTIAYHASCKPSFDCVDEVVVRKYGDSYLCVYYVNSIIKCSLSCGDYEFVECFILSYYGSFDRGVDNKFVFVDQLPNE